MSYPWLKRFKKSQQLPDPEPPIPLGDRSNGEYFHAQTPRERAIRELIFRRTDELAPRAGIDRRAFLASSAGMATSLWAINVMNGCGGLGYKPPEGGSGQSTGSAGGFGTTSGGTWAEDSGGVSTGGIYDVGDDPMATGSTGGEMECTEPLDGEFVFDIQTHHVNPNGSWRDTNLPYYDFFNTLPQSSCGLADSIGCFSVEHYIEQMFLNSETSVAVLSGIPAQVCKNGASMACGNPLTNQEIVESRELINALASSQRLVNHCMIMPNLGIAEQLEVMQMVHEELHVGGWKAYPPWGPDGVGWFLDSEIGLQFIQKGLDLGVQSFCIHKGLPLPGFDTTHTDPRDVGVVAKMFPDAKLVIYHSAWGHGGDYAEGPYDPNEPSPHGVNALIRSLQDNGLGPGSNVYGELGSVWTNVMAYPDVAAHIIGKLLLYLGEDNVCWGTDCIWTGSPQPLIDAFRAFQISERYQSAYGYPALTDEIKRKILGLNAAKIFGVDPDAVRCKIDESQLEMAKRAMDHELGPRRWSINPAAGPRNRREFWNLIKERGGPL